MIRKNKNLLIAFIVAACVVVAVPVFSVYYDIYGTNALLKGDAVIQRSMYLSGGMIDAWDTVGSAATATLTVNDPDYVLINKTVGLASLTVNLPQITSANSGKEFIFKQYDSGTTACTVTPVAGYDTIESTQGTITGTSDATVDALGDVKGWKAYYAGSGVSNQWLMITEDRS